MQKLTYLKHTVDRTALPLSAHATNSIGDTGETFGFMNVTGKDLSHLKFIFLLLCWY